MQNISTSDKWAVTWSPSPGFQHQLFTVKETDQLFAVLGDEEFGLSQPIHIKRADLFGWTRPPQTWEEFAAIAQRLIVTPPDRWVSGPMVAQAGAGTPVSELGGGGVVPPPPRESGTSDDSRVLDLIQHMLRDPEWAVGMLEDIADLVRGTGRDVENLPDDEPTWDRH